MLLAKSILEISAPKTSKRLSPEDHISEVGRSFTSSAKINTLLIAHLFGIVTNSTRKAGRMPVLSIRARQQACKVTSDFDLVHDVDCADLFDLDLLSADDPSR